LLLVDRLFGSTARVCFTVGLYFSTIIILRLWIFPGVAEDDAEQFYYAQSWALGYKGSQPPLFTWLVKVAEALVGVGALALFLLKYLILFGFYIFSYLVARAIIEDRGLAIFAAFSPIALYYVGWDGVVNYSNSLLLATSQAATLYALLRLRHQAHFGTYIFLGIAIASGFLAKYNFVLSLLPLLVAGLCYRDIRQALLSPKIIMILIMILMAVVPHGYWAVTDPEGLATVFNSSARPWESATHWVMGTLSGLGKLVVGVVAFTLPASLLMVACFARPLVNSRKSGTKITQFFEIYFASYFVILVAVVVATQATDIQNHWLMGMLPFSLYVFARLDAHAQDISDRARKYFGGSLIGLSLAVIVALAGRSIIAPDTCRKCNFFIPWADISSEIRAAGFNGGTIVAFDYPNQISGNLRRYFPNSRVMSARFSPLQVPSKKLNGSCLIIWSPNAEPAGYERLRTVEYANNLLGASLTDDLKSRDLMAEIAGSDGRTITLQYILINEGSADCR
jgi:hypothetical protein